MLGEESCVESLAKDDHVKVRDHQEDVDESDPASKRERDEGVDPCSRCTGLGGGVRERERAGVGVVVGGGVAGVAGVGGDSGGELES